MYCSFVIFLRFPIDFLAHFFTNTKMVDLKQFSPQKGMKLDDF